MLFLEFKTYFEPIVGVNMWVLYYNIVIHLKAIFKKNTMKNNKNKKKTLKKARFTF